MFVFAFFMTFNVLEVLLCVLFFTSLLCTCAVLYCTLYCIIVLDCAMCFVFVVYCRITALSKLWRIDVIKVSAPFEPWLTA